MDISNVIAIAGMPGLYKVVAQAKNGVIVESLVDKKRVPAFNSHKISALPDISIYTTSEDLPLKDVLQKIFDKEKGATCPDPKSLDEKGLRAYMSEVLPEYDEERVHVSDLRKLFTWYNMLHGAGLLTAEEKQEDADKKIVSEEKTKQPALKKDTANKPQAKTNAPKVKAQGVRKTGTA
jgi:phosphomannomutase